MQLNSLQELFLEELRDLYNAEKQILQALPKMTEKAVSEELKEVFTSHLEETKGQVKRLEQIFSKLGEAAEGKVCKGMEGVIEEGKEMLAIDGDPSVVDAALIGAAKRVEHYEMGGYESAIMLAQQLEDEESAELLQQTLEEEEAANIKLEEVIMAVQDEEDEELEEDDEDEK